VTGCRLPKLCLLPCSRILVRARFERVFSGPRHPLRFAEELERHPEVVRKKQWAGPLPCHPRSRRRPVTAITAGLSQSGSRSAHRGHAEDCHDSKRSRDGCFTPQPTRHLADRVEPSRRLNVRSLEMVWTSRQSGYRLGHISGYGAFLTAARREIWRRLKERPYLHRRRTW
jgi:hypothetical protein